MWGTGGGHEPAQKVILIDLVVIHGGDGDDRTCYHEDTVWVGGGAEGITRKTAVGGGLMPDLIWYNGYRVQ